MISILQDLETKEQEQRDCVEMSVSLVGKPMFCLSVRLGRCYPITVSPDKRSRGPIPGMTRATHVEWASVQGPPMQLMYTNCTSF